MNARSYFTIGLIIPLIGVFVGISVSRLYWGYWFGPPDSEAMIVDIASVERFSTFSWDGTKASGRSALLEEAAVSNNVSGDNPRGRLPAALSRRALLPTTSEAVDSNLLPAITSALAKADKLVNGFPLYPNAARLDGNIVVATTNKGDKVVLAALSGSEVSNDHYPYYEAVLAYNQANILFLQRLHFYYFDIAGLEGMAHWLAGIFTTLVGLVVWFLIGVRLLIIHHRRGAA